MCKAPLISTLYKRWYVHDVNLTDSETPPDLPKAKRTEVL